MLRKAPANFTAQVRTWVRTSREVRTKFAPDSRWSPLLSAGMLKHKSRPPNMLSINEKFFRLLLPQGYARCDREAAVVHVSGQARPRFLRSRGPGLEQLPGFASHPNPEPRRASAS
jgi:hypothetical protein